MCRISSFNLEEGTKINNKYSVISLLGNGWEGEVYLVKELHTGIERAAKFFFPHRNKKNSSSNFYAKKLHKLRNCSMVIQYYAKELFEFEGMQIVVLISEYIEGEILSEFIKKQRGKRLQPFVALHLLYSLTKGLEEIHKLKEYHGDLHSDNIIIQRFGLGFELKLLDLYRWDWNNGENMKDDVVDLIKIFYDSLGGSKFYSRQPEEIKKICCGLKKSIILKKFKSSTKLKQYLENLSWN